MIGYSAISKFAIFYFLFPCTHFIQFDGRFDPLDGLVLGDVDPALDGHVVPAVVLRDGQSISLTDHMDVELDTDNTQHRVLQTV